MDWLIIGGAARSGTSAFLKALNSNEKIFLIPEYYWSSQLKSLDNSIFKKYNASLSKINIGQVNNQSRPGANSLLIKDFLDYIPSSTKCSKAVIESIAYSCSGKKDLKYIGEKLPEYWRYTNFKQLAKISGRKVKLIHIARSPLHVLSSFIHRINLSKSGKDRFRFNTVEKALLHINESYLAYAECCKSPFIDTHFIKYESLFDRNKSTQSLEAFLQLNLEDISTYFKGERYGDIRNLNLDRTKLSEINPKLVYLSSIWEEDDALIASEIRSIWNKDQNDKKFLSSKTTWHYSSSRNLTNKTNITDNQPKASNKNSVTLSSRLFLHNESHAVKQKPIKKVTIEAQEELDKSILDAFGTTIRLDGLEVNEQYQKDIIDRQKYKEIPRHLNIFLQKMIEDNYMDAKVAANYQKNFLRNVEDLISLRHFHQKGYLKNDLLYSCKSQGFFSQQICTGELIDYLSEDIDHLRNSKHSQAGLDRSIIMNIDRKNADCREKLSEILNYICKNTLKINHGFEDGTVGYELRSATLHYSDYKDTHSYMTRLDEFPKPKLLNMHIDPLFTTRKIMIYLNDVDINSGPFSYVPESNRYLIDAPTLLKIKSFGKANYWPTSVERETLKVLPETLGLTNVFGSTCGSQSQKEDFWLDIAKNEVLFTDNENAIVFSPCGFHRGGINAFGRERIALQVILDLRQNSHH